MKGGTNEKGGYIMKIVLCDDDNFYIEQMQDIVKELTPDADIYCYTSANDLISSGNIFDIAFLDIEMDNGCGGFNAAQYVKTQNDNCVIAFFTNYDSYAREGYNYRAYRFILKDEGNQMIKHHLSEIVKEYNRLAGKISLIHGSTKVVVSIKDIMYIQMKDHYGDVYLANGEKCLWRTTLSNIVFYLSQFNFERCHNSYVVNMDYVQEKRKNQFILTNGEQITIGRTYIETYDEYTYWKYSMCHYRHC